MTSSRLGEDIVEDEEMKKGRRMNEVQIQENPKKKLQKSLIKVLGTDAKDALASKLRYAPSGKMAECRMNEMV